MSDGNQLTTSNPSNVVIVAPLYAALDDQHRCLPYQGGRGRDDPRGIRFGTVGRGSGPKRYDSVGIDERRRSEMVATDDKIDSDTYGALRVKYPIFVPDHDRCRW